MRPAAEYVGLFVEGLVTGAVTVKLSGDSVDQLIKLSDQWRELSLSSPDSKELRELSEEFYSLIRRGRIQRWIEGRFEETQLEKDLKAKTQEVKVLEAELRECKDDRTRLADTLSNMQKPPEKDLSAYK